MKKSFQETQLILNHCYAAMKAQGGTQEDLGKLIGEAKQRINEGLNANWRISTIKAEQLINRFGYPMRGKGQYLIAELYDSIDDFKKGFTEGASKRYAKRMAEFFSKKDFREYAAALMSDVPDGENNTLFKVERLQKEIETGQAQKWLRKCIVCLNETINNDSYRGYQQRKVTLPSLPESLKKLFPSDLREDEHLSFLFHLCYLKYYGLVGFNIAKPNRSYSQLVNLTEVTLTGDIILEDPFHQISECVSNHIKQKWDQDLAPFEFGQGDFLSEHRAILDNEKWYLYPDSYNGVVFKLFLSCEMRYNLHIRFYHKYVDLDHVVDRTIVIKDLSQASIIKDLTDLYAWIGIKGAPEKYLKHSIAAAGGYIPGVLVL